MKDHYTSEKQGITIRRIEIAGIAYTIRPSFVMPYMTAMTDDAENALFLREFSVPFRAVAYTSWQNFVLYYGIAKRNAERRMERMSPFFSLAGTTEKLFFSRPCGT
ncbi:hypothetical protein QUF80_04230 [Desulfococcaceae bacterium HSG8]|nr:hypothetical protein [Desulfococcaceae bacterium HSG8]